MSRAGGSQRGATPPERAGGRRSRFAVAAGAAVWRRAPGGPERLPRAGLVAWAAVFVALGLWELSALLLQPSLTTDSYAHPTISVLLDPVLAGHLGRSVVLSLWLASGWYLVGL
jgi:hypothetical protein